MQSEKIEKALKILIEQDFKGFVTIATSVIATKINAVKSIIECPLDYKDASGLRRYKQVVNGELVEMGEYEVKEMFANA